MQQQSGLGNEIIYRKPVYDQVQIGRVTSVADYDKYGRVSVIFLDYSQPFPVWVNGGVDRKPVEGDQVLVGFIQGRPDAPYLAGFIRNESYTANFLKIEKDYILLQLPADKDDAKEHLMDDTKLPSRPYIKLSTTGIELNHPTGNVVINVPSGFVDVK